MIKLPDNWRDTIRVFNNDKLIISFVNSNREFFFYLQYIDKTIPLDDSIEKMATGYPNGKAHTLADDLTTQWLDEPADQDWKPMSLPGDSLSLAQYKEV